MTAEIALLNKSAVALAADSAATVSTQDRQEKVFNTEDKLFELSNTQPIGVMIYNSTTFLETPVHILVKRYRSLGKEFNTVDEAAIDFRKYLKDFANSLDSEVKKRSFQKIYMTPAQLVQQRAMKTIAERASTFDPALDSVGRFRQVAENLQGLSNSDVFREATDFFNAAFQNAPMAEFTGRTALKFINRVTKEIISDSDPTTSDLGKLITVFLQRAVPSSYSTGFVIAGFARDELFPSLRSFEIDGLIADDLRYMNCSAHDIKLGESAAKVLPFAQQEMVAVCKQHRRE